MKHATMFAALLCVGCGESLLPDDCSLTTRSGDKFLLSFLDKPVVLVWQSLTCPRRCDMAKAAAACAAQFKDRVDFFFVYGEEAHPGMTAEAVLNALRQGDIVQGSPFHYLGPSTCVEERFQRCTTASRELTELPWLIEGMDGPISALHDVPKSPRTVIIDRRRVLLYKTQFPAEEVHQVLSKLSS